MAPGPLPQPPRPSRAARGPAPAARGAAYLAFLVTMPLTLSGCTGDGATPHALLLVASDTGSELIYVDAGGVLKRATAGYGAAALAVDAAADRAYVGSGKAATVAIIDLDQGFPVDTLVTQAATDPSANTPTDIALDGSGRLWVALRGANVLQAYEAATRQRVAQIDVLSPERLLASPDGSQLAVVWGERSRVSLVDLEAGGLQPPLLTNASVGSLAATEDRLLVGTGDRLHVFGWDGAPIAQSGVPALATAMAATGGSLLLAGFDEKLYRIDLANFRVAKSAPLPGLAAAIAPDGEGRVWVSVPGTRSVWLRDATSLGEIARVPLDAEPRDIEWVDLGEGRFRL